LEFPLNAFEVGLPGFPPSTPSNAVFGTLPPSNLEVLLEFPSKVLPGLLPGPPPEKKFGAAAAAAAAACPAKLLV
jgi:hypothetical protein